MLIGSADGNPPTYFYGVTQACDGHLWHLGNAFGSAQLSTTYQVDKWIHYKMDFDLDTDTVDVYQDNALILNNQAISDFTVKEIGVYIGDGIPGTEYYIDAISTHWTPDYQDITWPRCCGDDIGEDWGGDFCCCNSQPITQGQLCDVDQDYYADKVCDYGIYCNSNVSPTFTLSEKAVNPGEEIEINLTSACLPNLLVINPDLTETSPSLSSCGNNCYTSTINPTIPGYYHLQGFNGEYGYAMFLVKNDSLTWKNLWTSPDDESFEYRTNIFVNHTLSHSRINQLINMSLTFSDPAYCEDVNADGDYNDPVDLLGLRLINFLPGGGYHEVPFTLSNVVCSPDKNVTSALVQFPLNLPDKNFVYVGTGNVYAMYQSASPYNVKNYAGLTYSDGSPRYIDNNVLRTEFNPISNITQTLFNYLGTGTELQAEGDVLISPLEYNDGTTYTLSSNSVNNYEIITSPATINYIINGTMNGDSVEFNKTYHANSYYFAFGTNITFNSGKTLNWLKAFELNLNKTRFTHIANSTNVYDLNSAVDFDYDDKWITLFNEETGDGIALISIDKTGSTASPVIKFEPLSNNARISVYPIYTSTGVSASQEFTSNYALMVYNFSDHGIRLVENVWEWLNTGFDYTATTAGVSFEIAGYDYDEYVDKSDEQITANATVYSNLQDLQALRANVYDYTGNRTFSQDFSCTETELNIFNCAVLINPSNFDCQAYNMSLYAFGLGGNTTPVDFTFNINDITGTYSLPEDTLVSTPQQLRLYYEYCDNTSPENIILEVENNLVPIYYDNLPSTGEVVITYTNPSNTGNNNFIITANDSHYWDYKNVAVNVAKTIYTLNERTVAYPLGASGFNSNFLKINNTSIDPITYSLGLESPSIYSRFSENKKNKINVTVPAYSERVLYIDVFPVIIGRYPVTININSKVSADSRTIAFDALVQTSYSSGIFDYVMIPGLDWASMALLLIIASLFFLKQNF
jgi:hypothetical protein